METKNEKFISTGDIKPFASDPRAKWLYENLYGQYRDFMVEIVNDKVIIHGSIMIPYQYQELKVKIDEVYGDVTIDNYNDSHYGNLKSLKNFPTVIHGGFFCKRQKNLQSLEGGPEIVHGDFICANCGLLSLEHLPYQIDGNLYVFKNNLSNIDLLLENQVRGTIDIRLNPCENTETYNRLLKTGRISVK